MASKHFWLLLAAHFKDPLSGGEPWHLVDTFLHGVAGGGVRFECPSNLPLSSRHGEVQSAQSGMPITPNTSEANVNLPPCWRYCAIPLSINLILTHACCKDLFTVAFVSGWSLGCRSPKSKDTSNAPNVKLIALAYTSTIISSSDSCSKSLRRCLSFAKCFPFGHG